MCEEIKPKKETRRAARNHVFNIIFQAEFNSLEEIDEAIENYYDVLENETKEEKFYDPDFRGYEIDKKFVEKEIKGVEENIEKIDEMIKNGSKGWAFERIAKIDLAILRLAVYEILFEESIPDGVSINEAVELAKEYSSEKSPSFINGILASVLKEAK